MPLVLASCLGLGLFLGNILSSKGSFQNGSIGSEKYQKIQEIIEALDSKYVDQVNAEKLFETTISDMLHQLDPHSNYIPASELKAMNESIEGKFGGIGVRFFIVHDTICITHVIPNSPSQRAGLKAGDRFLQINGANVTGKKINNDKVMKLLKGTPNTKVNVILLRNGKRLKKQLVRGIIPIESISAAYMMDADHGYMKIDQFSVTTYEEFKQAAFILKEKGLKHLILDLRDNGGGVLSSATNIVDEFLGGKEIIVKTKGTHQREFVYASKPGGILSDVKLSVLINSNSASASEILAGAIQDNDRGLIFGRRSFGKGLVQEDVPLRDGSNLRLTVARYYTPTGRCIQKPYDGNYDSYYDDQNQRYNSGELYKPDTTKFVDSLKFKTPKGKTVYGGGGIMPDVFVPYDTMGMTWYLTSLRYSSAFQGFAFDYVYNRKHQWKNINALKQQLQINDALLNEFTAFAQKEAHIPFDAYEFQQSKSLIKKYLKAEIARQLFLEQGYFEVINEFDEDIKRVLKQK